jgi:hypothetical protein
MVCRARKLSRPKHRASKPTVKMRRFPAISGGIRFWKSARDRAIESGHNSLGRMADEIAEANRSAWARFAAEVDCCCPTCGVEIGPGRRRPDARALPSLKAPDQPSSASPGRFRARAENVAYDRTAYAARRPR